ncbi:MAG: hypothetical protein ACLGHN_04340 [Bacteriovoracia bacterium]
MKAFGLILMSLFLSTAHASWRETKCSNSDGSVNWKHGLDENQINLKYANFVEGTLSLNLEQVNVQLTKQVTLKEVSFRNCQYMGNTRVYAGKVKITGSDKHPDVLRSQFPENKVITEVICTTSFTAENPCTNE